MNSSQKVFEKLYAQQQAGGDAAAEGNGAKGNNSPYGDDVVDGDYKEV